jgi:mono/diheme cytochrome c family protein
LWGLAAVTLCLCACGQESRTLGPEQPQTPPNGIGDPRAAFFEGNAYQVAQGGRYFSWYGCASCHGDDAQGPRDLPGRLQRHPLSFDRVYAAIAAHKGVPVDYSARIPTEQLWQITAYVRSLRDLKPDRRRRQDLDQAGEPQAAQWSGAVR